MAITNYYKSSVYQTGTTSYPIFIASNDSKSVVTSANYIQPLITGGMVINPTDVINVTYANGVTDIFNAIFINGIPTLIPAIGVFTKDFTISATSLASFATVPLQISGGNVQFVVRDIRVNKSTGLSGGGGDRQLLIADGVTQFGVITAALTQTPVNTLWGATGNNIAPALAMNTPSVAGQNIYVNYFTGTTDYTAGSISITVTFERIA